MTESERQTDQPGQQQPRRDWRAVLVGVLLGSTVGDAAVNILSGDYRWRFVTIITATGLTLAVPLWLNRYPPRSTLVKATTRTLLTTGAVFIPAQPNTRLTLLSRIAVIAVGVAVAGLGAAQLADNDRLVGIAIMAVGVTAAGLGAAILADNDHLFGIARASPPGSRSPGAALRCWPTATACSASRSSPPGSRAPGSE